MISLCAHYASALCYIEESVHHGTVCSM